MPDEDLVEGEAAVEKPFDSEAFTTKLFGLFEQFEAAQDAEAKQAAWEGIVAYVCSALETYGTGENLQMPYRLDPPSPSVDSAVLCAVAMHMEGDPDEDHRRYSAYIVALYRSVAHRAVLDKIEAVNHHGAPAEAEDRMAGLEERETGIRDQLAELKRTFGALGQEMSTAQDTIQRILVLLDPV